VEIMSKNDIDVAALERDLQKLKKPQRGWFGRNWKWFLPVLILLLIVLGGGVYAAWEFNKVLGHEAYKKAMAKIRENEEIKKSLGEPITMVYLSPAPAIRKETTETDILWTIAGSSGKQAKVHIFQRLMSGKWETTIADATLPDGKKVSLEDEEGGAPPFVPQGNPAPADGNAAPPSKPTEESMPDDLMTPNIPTAEESK
jgi:hypothetical protein